LRQAQQYVAQRHVRTHPPALKPCSCLSAPAVPSS
jgi:hypothetical protein